MTWILFSWIVIIGLYLSNAFERIAELEKKLEDKEKAPVD
jgi:hypothetical protein